MNAVKMLSALKAEKLSLPAMIVLLTIKEAYDKQRGPMYIGETHAFFHSNAQQMGYKSAAWGYSAVGRMLNVLTERGLLLKEREGRYVMFELSSGGITLMTRLLDMSSDEPVMLKSA